MCQDIKLKCSNCLCSLVKTALKYEGGLRKKPNYLLEGRPLVVQASSARWVFQPICISAPVGGVVRGCIWLQWIIFEDSFNTFAHFLMGDLQAHLPTPCWVFSSFWPKMAWPPCPILLIHPISHQATFFVCLFSQMKNILKGNYCPDVEEVKQKNDRSTNKHQNWWVQKLLWVVKEVSIGVFNTLYQMESTLKVTEV